MISLDISRCLSHSYIYYIIYVGSRSYSLEILLVLLLTIRYVDFVFVFQH